MAPPASTTRNKNKNWNQNAIHQLHTNMSFMSWLLVLFIVHVLSISMKQDVQRLAWDEPKEIAFLDVKEQLNYFKWFLIISATYKSHVVSQYAWVIIFVVLQALTFDFSMGLFLTCYNIFVFRFCIFDVTFKQFSFASIN